MIDKQKLWDGFVAAMLHDVGKVILTDKGEWVPHDDLGDRKNLKVLPSGNDFRSLLGASVVDLINQHHENIDPRNAPRELVALWIADKANKALQHQVRDERDFNRLKPFPSFYPFYKQPTKWEPLQARGLAEQALKSVEGGPDKITVKKLLDAQQVLNTYPHSTYVPHISLSIHHRFTAVMYLFLVAQLERLTSPLELKEFDFSLIQVMPDQLGMLYRLRYVEAHKKISQRLNDALYSKLFVEYGKMLPKMDPNCNPFVFYRGDGLVLLHDDLGRVTAALQECVNEVPGLRSMQEDVTTFTIKFDWKLGDDGLYSLWAKPSQVNVAHSSGFLLANEMLKYSPTALYICQRCGKPTDDDMVDEKGNRVCQVCHALRNDKKLTSGIDLDRVAGAADGGEAERRLAYVFLVLPSDLLSHAKEVARDRLIAPFVDERRVPADLAQELQPSPTGLFEYLQALESIRAFESVVEQKLIEKDWPSRQDPSAPTEEKLPKDAGEKNGSAFVLIDLPSLKLYLLWEEKWWDFYRSLARERETLQLKCSIKIVIADHKLPFWSMIQRIAHFEGESVTLYDFGKETITVFNDTELRDIRQLADEARLKYRIYATQLETIAKVALNTSKGELLLELDTRRDRLGGFVEPLKKALERLSVEDQGNLSQEAQELRGREKRSVFIRYIAKLVKTAR